MEQNKLDEGLCCSDDTKLPPLSAKLPWFVVQNLEDLTHQFFYTLHNPLLNYQCRIPELSGKRIRGCFHGWIILSNHPHNDTWSLWNPSTSNIVSLPPLVLKDGDYDSISECCLSAPPDNSSSFLLLTISSKRSLVFCQLSPKRKKSLKKKPRWTEMSYAYQLERITWNGHLLHSLTCCNGQIYALCDDSDITAFVIRVEIVVKDREVLIKLLAIGAGPFVPSGRCPEQLSFLTGTCKELFYILVGFRSKTDKTPSDVYLFKLDTTSINWKDVECLKSWDMTGVEELDDIVSDYLTDLEIIEDLWEEVHDLSDTIFVVDRARDYSDFYNPAIASELGGYIHIHDKTDKVIYSYHLYDKTIVPSRMPSSVPPTSHMTMWECWLEDDHKEAKFIVNSKEQEDEMVITLITNNEVEVSECYLLDVPLDVLEMIMKLCVGVDYMNFRATCTRCHLAAPLIQWRKETSLRRLHDYSLVSPWLMVVDQIRGIITFTDPMMGARYFMRCSQLSITNETICCSRFGWLLFKNTDTCPTFFNPFTDDLRELPDQYYYLSTLWFSAPPTSSECMVVGFSRDVIIILNVALEQTWQVFDLYTNSGSRPICFPTFHGGDLYTLSKSGKLRVFKDLGEADMSWKRIKAKVPRSCSRSGAQYCLVNCEQHLLLVVMVGDGEPIEVFKLTISGKWEKVNGVGKHMIYICDTTCLCIEAKTPEMENKIYLAQSANKKIVPPLQRLMQNRSQFQQQPDFHITSSTILASTLHITRLNPSRNVTAPPVNTANPISGPGLQGGQPALPPIQANLMSTNTETQTPPQNDNINRVGNHQSDNGANPGAMSSFSSMLLWLLGGASSEGLNSFLSMFRDVRDHGQTYVESPRQENRATQTTQ